MFRILGSILLLIGVSLTALADGVRAPEINASSATTALALLSGGLLVLRSRRGR